jgi:hypothetical protein
LVNDGILEFFDRPVKYDADLQATFDQLAKEQGGEPPPSGRPVAEVIKEEAGLTEIVAEDVRGVLAKRHDETPDENDEMTKAFEPERWENPFDTQARYIRRDSVDAWEFESDWGLFERGLTKRTRHFNRTAEETLTSVFEGIDGLKTTNGRAVIVLAGPGTGLAQLYRARVFQSEDKLEEAMIRPDRDVGPPPSALATAGRMNAAGIAVFYGATSAEVALEEVRPPVGSKVLVGCFEVAQNLRLLDLDALELVADEHGSIFDPGHIYRLKKTKFLGSLCKRISRIVMPDDQLREYIPTQAVADFLANMETPSLDGVIYPSVQTRPLRPRGVFGLIPRTADSNVVLFHKAAVVQEMMVPERTWVLGPRNSLGLGSLLGEGEPEVEYTVFEETAGPTPAPDSNDAPLKLSSLDVYWVTGVRFDKVRGPIRRHKIEKTEPAR